MQARRPQAGEPLRSRVPHRLDLCMCVSVFMHAYIFGREGVMRGYNAHLLLLLDKLSLPLHLSLFLLYLTAENLFFVEELPIQLRDRLLGLLLALAALNLRVLNAKTGPLILPHLNKETERERE